MMTLRSISIGHFVDLPFTLDGSSLPPVPEPNAQTRITDFAQLLGANRSREVAAPAVLAFRVVHQMRKKDEPSRQDLIQAVRASVAGKTISKTVTIFNTPIPQKEYNARGMFASRLGDRPRPGLRRVSSCLVLVFPADCLVFADELSYL